MSSLVERLQQAQNLYVSLDAGLAMEAAAEIERLEADNQRLRNTGHGHVWERPDGKTARCGGPAVCQRCREDEIDLAGS